MLLFIDRYETGSHIYSFKHRKYSATNIHQNSLTKLKDSIFDLSSNKIAILIDRFKKQQDFNKTSP